MKNNFNLKKETIKKNIYLTISIISAFIFSAGILCTILGDNSPVKFIINNHVEKLIIPPLLIFILTYILYKKQKNKIKENK